MLPLRESCRPRLVQWSKSSVGALGVGALGVVLVASLGCSGRGGGVRQGGRGAGPEGREQGRELDALHYGLRLELDPVRRRVVGRLRLEAVATRAIGAARLDLVDLVVDGVRGADGRALGFEQGRGEVVVQLREPLEAGERCVLEVEYSGSPTKGLYFVGDPSDPAFGVDHVFTQGECEDARHWFPCLDHPSDRATSELWVGLPAGWTAVSNGERVGVEGTDVRRIEHWRMEVPHPVYLTTLVAGELARVEEVAGGLAFEYVAPERGGEGGGGVFGPLLVPSLGATPRILGFLEELTGRPYPYSKYSTACVDDFPFGGMENASATTVTLAALRSAEGRRDGNAEGLAVHEAAHQWFGDLLTCAEWPEIWLNEGFATYCSLLWTLERDGVEAFELAVSDTTERYLVGDEKSPRALVHGVYTEPMDLFFSGHAYQGGASRLHLLRDMLGDAAFRAGLRRYVGRFQHRAVTSADLEGALEEATGVELGPWFADWVHGPGHPVLDVAARFDARRQRVLVRVDQVHALEGGAAAAFRAPATISMSVGGEVTWHRVDVRQRRDLFELPAAAPPDWVVFDPRGVWPARVRHERGVSELAAVVMTHPSAVARRAAVRELARLAARDEGAVGALEHARTSEPEVAVRVAAVEASRGVFAAPDELADIAARGDEALRVRRAAFESLVALVLDGATAAALDRPRLQGLALAVLDDAAASWSVRGGAARLLVALEPGNAAAALDARLAAARPTGDDPHGVFAGELVGALGVAPNSAAAVELAARVARDVARPISEREAAVAALGAAVAESATARATLGELFGDRSVRVRRAAVGALASEPHPEARVLLGAHLRRTTDPRERYAIEGALGP